MLKDDTMSRGRSNANKYYIILYDYMHYKCLLSIVRFCSDHEKLIMQQMITNLISINTTLRINDNHHVSVGHCLNISNHTISSRIICRFITKPVWK